MKNDKTFNRFTINTSDICIYCEEKLSSLEKKGKGEHIFPVNIFGFLKSYDVCNKCKKYFGDKVDGLTLKNSHIFEALKFLKQDTTHFYHGVKFIGIDKHSKEEKDYFHHKGRFQVRNRETTSGDFVEFPEFQLNIFGKKWLIEKRSQSVKYPLEIIDKELNRICKKYNEIKHGEEIRSDLFKAVFRKRGVEKITTKEDLVYNINPLVSKIVIFILYFIFGHYYKTSYSNVNEFLRNCLERKDFSNSWYLGPLRIDSKEIHYKKFHELRFTNLNSHAIIDIVFFGEIVWRAFLENTNKEITKELLDFYEFIFYLNFESDNARELVIAIRENEKDKLKYLTYDYQDSF